jgi:cytochrome oxidase Cu insertion factor (SCO1/SenC/PrrC family)
MTYLTGEAIAHDGVPEKTSSRASGSGASYAFPLPEPGSYRLPPIRSAAGGTVLTAEGVKTDLAALFPSRITVFSFIYTRCADICPIATMQLAQLRELAAGYPELGNKVRLVSMSFDPDHDTPHVMAEYGALWRDADDGRFEWLFLTAASQAVLRPILTAYDQAVAADPDPKNPTGGLNHILRVFLVDENGLVRNIYSMDFLDPALVVTDILTVARKGTAD